ncbi:MAG TPA: hypothetical protein VFE71_02830 [Bacteroidales bacterium]|nr:hypothetical protein [Bacteroidales bacterium]
MVLSLTEVSEIKTQYHLILVFFFILMVSCSMEAQSWNFIKEKDGIKIYTRMEAGKSLKS